MKNFDRFVLATSLLTLLGACGGGNTSPQVTDVVPPNPNVVVPTERMCSLDHLSTADILSVKREPEDSPLASLSHYQARNVSPAGDAVLNSGACAANTSFKFATGLGDITGPVSGTNMSGYVDGEQVSTGLIERQYARAFAFESNCENRTGRAVLVQLDLGLMFSAIRQGVLDALAADDDLKDVFTKENLLLNASHSHNSAGGQSHYDAYHILTNGHDVQSYDAAVSGIVAAIRRAYNNLQTATAGSIRFNQGELLNGTVNRSLPAFMNNPEAERNQFVDTNGEQVTTNRMMTLLRLQRDDGTQIGMLNWYAIHVTSIYQQNTLLSGDNKGYAAWRFERDFATEYFSPTDAEPFLSGFMQADEGDASPSPFIIDLTEAELRDQESPGFRARGGGRTEPEHALISGFKQYRHARQLYNTATEQLVGEVAAQEIEINWSTVQIANPGSYPEALQPQGADTYESCSAALGVSFAGGAEDGRGPTAEGQTCDGTNDPAAAVALLQSNFEAGMNGALPPGVLVPAGCDNPVYDSQNYDCHAEKPIIFPLNQRSPFNNPGGNQTLEPQTLPIQIITLGNLAVVAVPWEVTTTSGRRIRNAVLDSLQDAGIDYAVISGLSNGFVHYMTTREEYATQQYEGASTIFGPWTQEAVKQELQRLAGHIRAGTQATSPFENAGVRSERSAFVKDTPANDGNPGQPFGTVTQQPDAEYQISEDRVTVTTRFVGGHPRNDLKSEGSYVFVEQLDANGIWQTLYDDDHWFVRFEYEEDASGNPQGGTNVFRVDWILPEGTEAGMYRIRHEGASNGGAYNGVTDEFELLACDS